jgi:hypothetical protein
MRQEHSLCKLYKSTFVRSLTTITIFLNSCELYNDNGLCELSDSPKCVVVVNLWASGRRLGFHSLCSWPVLASCSRPITSAGGAEMCWADGLVWLGHLWW